MKNCDFIFFLKITELMNNEKNYIEERAAHLVSIINKKIDLKNDNTFTFENIEFKWFEGYK